MGKEFSLKVIISSFKGQMQEREYLVFCEKNSRNATNFFYVRITRLRSTQAAERVMSRSAVN
jgi:hypothetical protein